MIASSPTSDHLTLVERILGEGPIGMSVAARRLGVYRQGKGMHPSNVTRMHHKGFRDAAGNVVKLEAIRLQGRLVTSWPAVVRYIQAQQVAASAENTIPPRSPAARTKASVEAGRRLEEMGC